MQKTEKAAFAALSLVELAELEPATSWVRFRRPANFVAFPPENDTGPVLHRSQECVALTYDLQGFLSGSATGNVAQCDVQTSSRLVQAFGPATLTLPTISGSHGPRSSAWAFVRSGTTTECEAA
jgi:hypothetical protein